jgi:hypothetical protein
MPTGTRSLCRDVRPNYEPSKGTRCRNSGRTFARMSARVDPLAASHLRVSRELQAATVESASMLVCNSRTQRVARGELENSPPLHQERANASRRRVRSWPASAELMWNDCRDHEGFGNQYADCPMPDSPCRHVVLGKIVARPHMLDPRFFMLIAPEHRSVSLEVSRFLLRLRAQPGAGAHTR